MKKFLSYCILIFLLLLFAGIQIPRVRHLSELSRLTEDVVSSAFFRSQPVKESVLAELSGQKNPGKTLGIYWLETDFEQLPGSLKECSALPKRWERVPGWQTYLNACRAVWDDIVYFPVAEDPHGKYAVTFENSWLFDRTYKGERGHEGTDLMPSVNKRGIFPVVSMTDGVVESMGWLELGGWRIGIRAPHGAYFYYAHLDSYTDIKVGDQVRAGDMLGFMGDTGYGKEEGTRGKFPVHLHLGIYLTPEEEEISVNPYAALRYVERRKIECSFANGAG